jgi:Reverse transcriptase (RNA-dependent DNA polymerase)
VDIKSAYLNAPSQNDIYMRAPPGYLKPGEEGKVLKLLHSLYGLKQAGFEWSEELERFFLEAGFTRSQIDQAVYFKQIEDEHTVITVSVDDMAVTSKHLKHIEKFKHQLCKHFEITDLGELTWLLGLKIERNRAARTITLSQEAYANTIIQHFRLEYAKPAHIPMETGVQLTKTQSDHPPGTKLEIPEQHVPYQQAIRSLMYAATCTQPDIAFAVSILSQFMREPAKSHWEAVKHVIRYLKATRNAKLTLGGKEKDLEAYVDVYWASQAHRHSISGYVV